MASAFRATSYTQSRSYYMTRRVMAEAEKSESAEAAKDGAETAAPAQALTAEEAAKIHDDLAATKKALEETAKALTESKDRLARTYADLENTVRIAKRDVANAKDFGIKGFASKMFDVLDTVDLCLANLPKEGIPEGSHLDSAVIALNAINKQFTRVMAEYDVTPIETQVGDKFDSKVHNAIFEMAAPHPDHPLQTVGAIVKGGWIRKDVLVRPTHVGVVMRPHQG